MHRTAALLLLLAVSAPPAPAQPAATPAVVSAPALPHLVGRFRLYATTIHADSMIGVNYTYTLGRNLTATVAVHPSLTLQGQPAMADSVLAGVVGSFKRNLPPGTAGGRVALLRDRPDTLVVGTRVVPGHVVAAYAGRRVRVWYVYFLGSRYVRVMGEVTGPIGVPEQPADVLDAFARQVVPLVATAWHP